MLGIINPTKAGTTQPNPLEYRGRRETKFSTPGIKLPSVINILTTKVTYTVTLWVSGLVILLWNRFNNIRTIVTG